MSRFERALSCLVAGGLLATAGVSNAAPADRAQQAPRIVLRDDGVELEKALASRAPVTDLAVRVGAVPLPADEAGAVKLLVLAEIDDRREGPALTSVAYAVIDDKGQRRAHALRRSVLRRSPSGALAFIEAVTLPPGTYRLTVGAMRSGQVGSGDAAVVARLQSSASVRVGGLIVGDVDGEEAMQNVWPEARLRADRLVATLPLAAPAAALAAVDMTLEVATAESTPALVSARLAVLPGDGPTRLAQAATDTRVLPPGNYVARVTVAAPGVEPVRVASHFSIDRASADDPAGRAAAAAPSAGATRGTGSAGNAATGAAGFSLDDVLRPDVLGPFLDDLASRASPGSRPAIEKAKAGRFAEAVEASRSDTPTDPAGPFLLGLSLLSSKQLQPASQAFRDALKAAPDYFAGAFYIGACYAAGGRDQLAVNAWQTSLVGLDEYPVVFRLMSEAQVRMGQADRALQTLDEAHAKWPGDPDIRLRLARAALDARRYQRVVAIVDEAKAGPPADADLLFTGMQAIFEQATRGAAAPSPGTLETMKRYRQAYVAAGGPRQSLVDEWLAAVEKKLGK